MLVLHVIAREYQNLDLYVSRGRPDNIDLLKDQKTEPVQLCACYSHIDALQTVKALVLSLNHCSAWL